MTVLFIFEILVSLRYVSLLWINSVLQWGQVMAVSLGCNIMYWDREQHCGGTCLLLCWRYM